MKKLQDLIRLSEKKFNDLYSNSPQNAESIKSIQDSFNYLHNSAKQQLIWMITKAFKNAEPQRSTLTEKIKGYESANFFITREERDYALEQGIQQCIQLLVEEIFLEYTLQDIIVFIEDTPIGINYNIYLLRLKIHIK